MNLNPAKNRFCSLEVTGRTEIYMRPTIGLSICVEKILDSIWLLGLTTLLLGLTASKSIADDSTAQFVMLTGEPSEVCKAYQKFLDAEKWVGSLQCDRVFDDSDGPLYRSKRIYLTAEEIYTIYDKVTSFRLHGDQIYGERVRKKS